jgi:hypothetical protein
MENTVNNPSGGSVDGGGARPFDFSGIDLSKFAKNYTFIKPFKTTIGSKDADALLKGATPFQEINFKIAF